MIETHHYTYRKLIKAVLPSIGMMVFTSIYGIVDGFFVSNFAGKLPFAALNFIMPFIMACWSLNFMISSGGSALISYYLGAGSRLKANRTFSMLLELVVLIGLILGVFSCIFMKDIAGAMGATDAILDDAVLYGRINMAAAPLSMLYVTLQGFFPAVGAQKIGFKISLISGFANMVLDFLLMYVIPGGIVGAAVATVLAQVVGLFFALRFFLRNNVSRLRFIPTAFVTQPILKSCSNGVSELLSNIAFSIVSMAYNYQLIRLAGENGVAAYGVMMYVAFIFVAIFYGYAMQSNPLVGFSYGARDKDELHNILKKSIVMLSAVSVAMLLSSEIFAEAICQFFVGYDGSLYAITLTGMRIYSICYLICGFNIFFSAFFTGLNNGLLSGIIAFARSMVFELSCVFIIPIFFGLTGIWCSVTVAELLTLVLCLFILKKNQKRYGY